MSAAFPTSATRSPTLWPPDPQTSDRHVPSPSADSPAGHPHLAGGRLPQHQGAGAAEPAPADREWRRAGAGQAAIAEGHALLRQLRGLLLPDATAVAAE